MNDDLLYSNRFVQKPDVDEADTARQIQRRRNNFSKYIQRRQRDLDIERKREMSSSLMTVQKECQDISDGKHVIKDKYNSQDLMSTNRYYDEGGENDSSIMLNMCQDITNPSHLQKDDSDKMRYFKERVTNVNIDSRHRIKTLYPKQNNYKFELPREFVNVKSISIKSTEFTNTDTLIKSTGDKKNNKIHWQIEDQYVDDRAEDYSNVYANGAEQTYIATIPDGNYTSSSLASTIQNKMNEIQRVSGDYNNFTVEINDSTDLVSFKNFKTTNLANPFKTTSGSKTVEVFHSSHGFTTGTLITISNSSKIGGIDRGLVNTSHVITVPNDPLTGSGNLHVYNITIPSVAATESASDLGGDSVGINVGINFKLLFSQEASIGTTIGFNASDTTYASTHLNQEILSTKNISHSLPLNPIKIITTEDHNFKTGDTVYLAGHFGSPADTLVNDNNGYYLTETASGNTFTIAIDASNGSDSSIDEAIATLNTTGGIEGVTMTTTGSYSGSLPTVNFIDGSGSGHGASGTAIMGLTGIVVADGGSGYTSQPSYTFSNGGSGYTLNFIFGKITNATVVNGGKNYDSTPTLTINTSTGSGAELLASVGLGSITGVTIVSSGSGYKNTDTVSIIHENGYDGSISLTIAEGVITDVEISGYSLDDNKKTQALSQFLAVPALSSIINNFTDELWSLYTGTLSGFNSTTPAVVLSGGGTNNQATLNLTATSIIGVSMGNVGADYNSSLTTVSFAGIGSGATGIPNVNGISSIKLSDDFSGTYMNGGPIVTFSGGGGGGAAAFVDLHPVKSINVVNPGINFTETPTANIVPAAGDSGTGATLRVNLIDDPDNNPKKKIGNIEVIDSGKNYLQVPTVVITPHTDDAASASGYLARATIAVGEISKFNITSGGTGFTSIPDITLQGAGGFVYTKQVQRPVNLTGEKYILIISDLGTGLEDGNVSNVLGKVQLSGPTGSALYNTYINSTIVFEELKDSIRNIEFSFKTGDNKLFDFKDVDHSFTLEFVEYIDLVKGFNKSSKRGIVDTTL